MIKKKDRSLFIFCLVLFLGVVSSLPEMFSEAAGNYRDTRHTVSSASAYRNYYTGGRAKLDYTSSYAYNDGSSMSFIAAGVGRKSASGTIYTNTIIDSVSIARGQSKYIRQNVKEYRYTYGSLRITPRGSGRLNFLWSPDSI